jgi:hypothetical protein
MLARLSRRAGRHSASMGAMMVKLGIDPAQAAREARGAQLAAAARCCLFCEATGACERWIEAADPAAASPPSFCPNADFFGRVRALAPPA